MISNKPIRWWELRWPEVDAFDRDRSLIIQPLGSIEQHGRHLPIDTDIHNPLQMAESVSSLWSGRGNGDSILVAPPVWWGVSPHHLSFPGTLSIRTQVMADLLGDICASFSQHGFTKILFLNGHGGNAGTISASTLRIAEELGLSVASTSYWELVRDVLRDVGESAPGGMGHACEMETSLQLFFRPGRVNMAEADVDIPTGLTSFSHVDFRDPGSVMFPWNFRLDSSSGTMGDPTSATAPKGEVIAVAVRNRLDQLAAELLEVPQVRFSNAPLRQPR